MSSPERRPVTGDPLAKKLGDLASPVSDALASVTKPQGPAIPLNVVDGPSQRAYAAAVYIALFAWRIYDYTIKVKDGADSLFFFMKWATIDGLFIYGLPALRIPWLEWSGTTSLVLFVLHALLDWLLMFRVPVPMSVWFLGLSKLLYDRELSVSERRVKPADILRNSDLILGKQTIHVLPEGSAMLNPDHQSYCINSEGNSVTVAIRINQTNPIEIVLNRVDLNTNVAEKVYLDEKELRALKKHAESKLSKKDRGAHRDLELHVRRTGLYRLDRVLDESRLAVHAERSYALIVLCPSASLKQAPADKCKGELSDLVVEVVGTPPLTIKYSRIVNKEDRGFSFQSIQPDNLKPALEAQKEAEALGIENYTNMSWARPYRIDVPVNESLNTLGEWYYSIEEVHDARGNVANYSLHQDDSDLVGPGRPRLHHNFAVHPRPKISLEKRNSPCDLKVARGRSAQLPITFEASGRAPLETPLRVSYKFTPLGRLEGKQEHADDAVVREFHLQSRRELPEIKQPGLYSLEAVGSFYCGGEVFEPTTCMLTNPPEPELSISSENIYDSCAESSIGLRVDLDLIGTPPFEIHYEVTGPKAGIPPARSVVVDSLRGQVEFRPLEAGHYVYRFKTIKDKIYDTRHLPVKALTLEQDVKPLASASFENSDYTRFACLDQSVTLDINLQGEQPWNLEYEVVHRDKRNKFKVTDIEKRWYSIVTEPLTTGGEYTVALVSVQDRSGCKVFLRQEVKIHVPQERPRASFGLLEGERAVLTMESTKVALPIRLGGQPPWTVHYRKIDEPSSKIMAKVLHKPNDAIEVVPQGVYQLLDVTDASCPGTVEPSASKFEVRWFARPSISVVESSVLVATGDKYVRSEVCEGDNDATQLTLLGSPPFDVKYQQLIKPDHGAKSISNKGFSAALGVASIQMETSHAGIVQYTFSRFGDEMYPDVPLEPKPLVIEQRVNPKPSAQFAVPGKSYRYCMEEEDGMETIALTLQGAPPFYLELAIKHHSKPEPEIVPIANIDTKQFNFRIPHHVLDLGNHQVSVRRIQDKNGCQRVLESGSPHVLVKVADAPTITPFEDKEHHCVGDRISYTLSGTPPFTIFYTFQGKERRASASTNDFRRIAETPGEFEITGISDDASNCKVKTSIRKVIHEMPRVKVGKGRETITDIHEGKKAEIRFEFSGAPPFEFTYTRTGLPSKANKKPRVLETKTDVSVDMVRVIEVSQEGTYEAVAIKDRFCAFPKDGPLLQGSGKKLIRY